MAPTCLLVSLFDAKTFGMTVVELSVSPPRLGSVFFTGGQGVADCGDPPSDWPDARR